MLSRLLAHHAAGPTRRAFLAAVAGAVAGRSRRRTAFAESTGTAAPVTGDAVAGLEPFDELMQSFLAEHGVPGASLAVSRGGRVVYARGFGYADVDASEPVAPAALFRIASISKPVTAVAVMRLVEQGRLQLDDCVAERMDQFLPEGAEPDVRWNRITVRQCLQHTGGWDRGKSFDPIARPWDIAEALGIEPPVAPSHIVRYMLGRPLDFDPGERYAYSNFGYLVLGRIVEAVTGEPYEAHVRKAVLAPLGITAMQLGRALIEHRAPGEVKYYAARERTSRALYPPRVGQPVPIQYGGENLEAFEAHGGWIASAVDLVKFAAAFDAPANCPILGEEAIRTMWARPEGAAGTQPDGTPRDAFYGCGWSVRPVGDEGKLNAWHAGRIAGTSTLLVRRWDGLNWAVLFNTESVAGGQAPAAKIDSLVHQAAAKVAAWPEPPAL